MASYTALTTVTEVSYTDAQRVTVVSIGEIPMSDFAYSLFTSSAWAQFSAAVPTTLLTKASDPEHQLKTLLDLDEGGYLTDVSEEVVSYYLDVYYNQDVKVTPTTHWRAAAATGMHSSTLPQATHTAAASIQTVVINTNRSEPNTQLKAVAIALPICLATLFFFLGFLLWYNRHRIVQDLHRRYFGPNFNAPPLDGQEIKRWSNDTFSSTPLSDLPIRRPDTPEVTAPLRTTSSRHTPENPIRAHGTPNFPGPRQYLLERSRCITPDTPSGRREQLESRSQLIQQVHQRAREGSLTPDVPDQRARRVVSLDRVNEERGETSEHVARRVVSLDHVYEMPERPVSPTGSIRIVSEGGERVVRRAASDAITRRLEEAFRPEWEPEGVVRSPTT